MVFVNFYNSLFKCILVGFLVFCLSTCTKQNKVQHNDVEASKLTYQTSTENNEQIDDWSFTSDIIFSTYFGENDQVYSMKKDLDGNIYMGGVTSSNNFPKVNSYQEALQGYSDAFLAKVAPTGKVLWSTMIGGSNEFHHSQEMNALYGGNMGELEHETINSICITEDSVYAGGYTNAETFPEFKRSTPHDYWFLNSFIIELTFDGDIIRVLELPYIEENGYIVLQDFQWIDKNTVIVSGLQRLWSEKNHGIWSYCISSFHVDKDVLTLRWKKTVAAPEVGGSQGKYGKAIDSMLLYHFGENIYTACTTSSKEGNGNSNDETPPVSPFGLLCCFNYNGDMLWNQTISATNASSGFREKKSFIRTHIFALTANEQGIYIGGKFKQEGVLPKQTNEVQELRESNYGFDGFVTKLSHDGNIVCSRSIGGSNDDAVFSIAVNENGMLFVTGSTNSLNFPMCKPLQDYILEKETCFVSVFSKDFTMVFSTYFGGSLNIIPEKFKNNEYKRKLYLEPKSRGLFIIADSETYTISGYTINNTFPTKNAFQSEIAESDLFGVIPSIFLSDFSFLFNID